MLNKHEIENETNIKTIWKTIKESIQKAVEENENNMVYKIWVDLRKGDESNRSRASEPSE